MRRRRCGSGRGVLLAAGAQEKLSGEELSLGHPRCRGGMCSRPAGGVPPQCLPGSCEATEVEGEPADTAALGYREQGSPKSSCGQCSCSDKAFLWIFFFFPSDKKIIIQVLLKMLFALKLPLYSFFLVKKGTLRTNQAGKYSVSSRYVPFSTSSFFKHNYQKKKLLTWILPIKMNRKNKSKNLKTVFVLLQGTHRVFVPCLTASQQKWHLSEVFIWALASHIKTFILLTLL